MVGGLSGKAVLVTGTGGGSIAGSRGAFFMPHNAHGAAKGGVLALTGQLAVEGRAIG